MDFTIYRRPKYVYKCFKICQTLLISPDMSLIKFMGTSYLLNLHYPVFIYMWVFFIENPRTYTNRHQCTRIAYNVWGSNLRSVRAEAVFSPLKT